MDRVYNDLLTPFVSQCSYETDFLFLPIYPWNCHIMYSSSLQCCTAHRPKFCLLLVLDCPTWVCAFGIPMACHIVDREPMLPTGQFWVQIEIKTKNPFVIWGLQQMDRRGTGSRRAGMSGCAAASSSIKELQLFINKCSLKLCVSLSIISCTRSL